MPLEKPYLRQINLDEDSKFAKKPYILQFCRRSKRAAPNNDHGKVEQTKHSVTSYAASSFCDLAG